MAHISSTGEGRMDLIHIILWVSRFLGKVVQKNFLHHVSKFAQPQVTPRIKDNKNVFGGYNFSYVISKEAA